MGLDLNVVDGLGETALGLALWTEQFDTGQRLLQMGAELEMGRKGGEGEEGEGGRGGEPGLLYVAIIREKPRACIFLLDHGAGFKTRYPCTHVLYMYIHVRMIHTQRCMYNVCTCIYHLSIHIQTYIMYMYSYTLALEHTHLWTIVLCQ